MILSNPAAYPVDVTSVVDECTATAGADFVPTEVPSFTFEPGETSRDIELSYLDDRLREGDEVVALRFGSSADVEIEQPWGEWRIRDDEKVRIAPSPPRADFDRDGRTDLVWRKDGGGAVAIWTMDGTTRIDGFVVDSQSHPDLGWEIVAVGDFDLDGDADIAWRNRTSGRLSLWTIENGTVVAGTLRDGMTDLAWRVVGGADLDRDGRIDLLWWNSESGELRAWLMDGWQLREERPLDPPSAASSAWRPVALDDLDGDRSPDLVWRNSTSNRLSVWYLDGTTRREGTVIAADADPGPEWALVGGWDVDFDGTEELLFQNVDTKGLLVWYVRSGALRCAAGMTPNAPLDRTWTLVGPR